MESKKVLKEGVFSAVVVFVIAVLFIVSLAFPFARYIDSNIIYNITGFKFLTGTTVMQGTAFIAAQGFMFSFLLAGAALMVISSIAFGWFYLKRRGDVTTRSIRFFGLLTLFGGLLAIVTPILFLYNENELLDAVKKPSIEMGLYIVLIIAIIAVGYSVWVLFRNKTILVLDFMILPGLIYVIINNYIPLSGIIVAFKKIDFSTGIFASPWIGLDNFKFMFQSNDAYFIIRNTVLYNIVFIITVNIGGMIIGYFLSECTSKLLKRSSQTLILLPQLISAVIISYIVYGFLATDAGWINKAILGGENSISFYSKPAYWPFILTTVNFWRNVGYSSLIYLASILSIDKHLYEAAYMDGCGKLRQFTKITLPMLIPTIIILFIMSIGKIMNSDFGLFYQTTMNSGALYRVTQTLDVYVYRAIMENNSLGRGAAAAAFQSVVGFALVLAANALVRKFSRSNAMF